jgi:hypothetical protein
MYRLTYVYKLEGEQGRILIKGLFSLNGIISNE